MGTTASKSASHALVCMRNSMNSMHASMVYVSFAVRATVDGNRVNVAKAALRDVITRCVCREVGFSRKALFEQRLRAIFGSYFEHDEDVYSQILNAFHRNVRSAAVHCAFRSKNSSKKHRPRQRRSTADTDASDKVVMKGDEGSASRHPEDGDASSRDGDLMSISDPPHGLAPSIPSTCTDSSGSSLQLPSPIAWAGEWGIPKMMPISKDELESGDVVSCCGSRCAQTTTLGLVYGNCGQGVLKVRLFTRKRHSRFICIPDIAAAWRTTESVRIEMFERMGLACQCCGTPEHLASLQMCSACRKARYCSKACQTKHWRAHKTQCLC